MSDKFTLAKKTLYSKPIGVIIAGASRRPFFDEPRSLLSINNTNLINHQIKIINDLFHTPDIIFVGGYQIEKIQSSLTKPIRIGVNENYNNSSIIKTIQIGLNINILDSVLIIYGDMFFNHDIFDHLHTDTSSAIYSNKKNKKQEVGVVVNGNSIDNFSYNSKSKWAQILYLTGTELKKIKELCNKKENENLMGFEILNQMINQGGKLKAIETEAEFFIDIDTLEDYRKTKRYLSKGRVT